MSGKIIIKDIFSEYENSLCDRVFAFELENGQNFNVAFFREQFCHLAGFQHVYGQNSKMFLGKNGCARIKSGKITAEKMKQYNKSGYNQIKERLKHFCLIPEIMENGYLLKFYQDRVKPRTKIQADFVLYTDRQACIVHLFLRKETLSEKNCLYAPVSFVVKSADDDTAKQFIQNQEYKKILSRSVQKTKSI